MNTSMNAVRLRQLLLHAVEYVPFYRQHWRAHGVDLTRVGSAVHLEFLPVVTHADLADHVATLRADEGATRRRRWRFINALREVGYTPGQKLMLISNEPLAKKAAFLRWTHADARAGEAEVFATYARTRPHVIHGPLNSLVLLARRMLATPDVKHRPKLVVSTGQQLSDAQRTLLESAFSARVADFYSVRDLGLIAYSAPGSRAYQIQTNDFHVELLRADAGRERLVVTDLGEGPIPLIRFDTGDLVRRDLARAGTPVVEVCGKESAREEAALDVASDEFLSPFEVERALDRGSRAATPNNQIAPISTIDSTAWNARPAWSGAAALRP